MSIGLAYFINNYLLHLTTKQATWNQFSPLRQTQIRTSDAARFHIRGGNAQLTIAAKLTNHAAANSALAKSLQEKMVNARLSQCV
jgi:hypothetical protein